MRVTTRLTVEHYLEHLQLSGDVLEIGALSEKKSARKTFPAPRFRYVNADLAESPLPDSIVADITDCRATIADESFDIVISCDVFEHIDRPWLAASEISRILRPGGIAVTRTLWSWRNHPCPIDYWRFSPQCLDFLFSDLESLESGYDICERRMDMSGFWTNGRDSVPRDAFGGFRENWAVYSVHRKGSGPTVPRFKDADHAAARHLRADTQGTVTSPTLLGTREPDAVDVVSRVAQLEATIDTLTERLARSDERSAARSRALDRRVVGMGQPLALRAYRKWQRRRDQHARARAAS